MELDPTENHQIAYCDANFLYQLRFCSDSDHSTQKPTVTEVPYQNNYVNLEIWRIPVNVCKMSRTLNDVGRSRAWCVCNLIIHDTRDHHVCLRSEHSEWTIETIARDGVELPWLKHCRISKLKKRSPNPGIFSEWLALWGSVMGV